MYVYTGFHIKKDWILNIDARSLHYDPDVFDNPTVFDPSRFDVRTNFFTCLVASTFFYYLNLN
jgi:cytochrome P450